MSERFVPRAHRLPALLAGGLLAVAAVLGSGAVRHELVAVHTAGSQARVRAHHREGLDPAGHAVGHCAHATMTDTERCLAAEDARDRTFYRANPRKPR